MDKKGIDLSIIIVSYNTEKLTRDCIESVAESTKGISYEFLVIDNASKDNSVKALEELSKKLPLTLIANSDNKGFGAANNQGMKKAKGKYLLLLNSDTLVKDNVLGEMVAWMNKNPKVGISTSALKNADGSLQGTGGYFPMLSKVFAWMFFIDDIPFLSKLIKPYHLRPLSTSRQLDWITGAYFLFRRQTFNDVGFFDKDYFMYVEELDFCFRAKKKGWQIWYLPQWNIIHYGGASGTSEFALLSEYKGIKIFFRKHMPAWQIPILRFCLKTGAFLRIILFGAVKGFSVAKIYAKAFAAA